MGVRARLGDVVAADRDGVVVPDAPVDERLLDVPHRAQGELGREDAGVLRLVLFQDVRLHRPAHDLQRVGFYTLVRVFLKHVPLDQIRAGATEEAEAAPVVPLGQAVHDPARAVGDVGWTSVP